VPARADQRGAIRVRVGSWPPRFHGNSPGRRDCSSSASCAGPSSSSPTLPADHGSACRGFRRNLALRAGTAARGSIALLTDVRSDLAGRPVLLVEDILDTGYTCIFSSGCSGSATVRGSRPVSWCESSPPAGRGPDRLPRLRHPRFWAVGLRPGLGRVAGAPSPYIGTIAG